MYREHATILSYNQMEILDIHGLYQTNVARRVGSGCIVQSNVNK